MTLSKVPLLKHPNHGLISSLVHFSSPLVASPLLEMSVQPPSILYKCKCEDDSFWIPTSKHYFLVCSLFQVISPNLISSVACSLPYKSMASFPLKVNTATNSNLSTDIKNRFECQYSASNSQKGQGTPLKSILLSPPSSFSNSLMISRTAHSHHLPIMHWPHITQPPPTSDIQSAVSSVQLLWPTQGNSNPFPHDLHLLLSSMHMASSWAHAPS